jgi:hypothetical protein
MGVENIASQAVAANLAAASQNLDSLVNLELDKKLGDDSSVKTEESSLKKALSGKQGEVGTQILVNIASKLAQSLPTTQILNSFKKDYEFVFNNHEEPTSDQADIHQVADQVAKAKKPGLNNNSGGEAGGQESGADPHDQKAAIREYIGAYSECLVSGGSDAKKKAENLEHRLVNEVHVSVKDLQSIKGRIASSVRTEVLKQVKNAYLKNVLASGKSLESVVSKKELANFIDYAFYNDQLGGYDFGGQNGNLQGAVDEQIAQTHEELRDFMKDDIKHQMIRKAVAKSPSTAAKGKIKKEDNDDLDALLKLGNKIGFDLPSVLAKLPQMKDDLGLLPVIEFEEAPLGGAAGGGSNQDTGRRHNYQYTAEEEKELLTDKLRAIFLHRAVYNDARTVLETQFKMIKLKNGLIKLGASNLDEIEDQGKMLAKVKLYGMLKEAFEERATYAKLSGEAWKMTEKKIKTVLKNLEKLGVQFTQAELDLLKDKANVKMYEEAAHEYSLVQASIEARGEVAYLTQKRSMLREIMGRNAAESGLPAPAPELASSVSEAC